MKNGVIILLIEDEPGMIITIRDRLEGEGYTVVVRENGREGFEEALKSGFDIILLDIMLPEKDGLEICRDLRARGVDTPVIMITARSQVVDRVLGLKIGADDYLVKPFDFMELTARIEALLRRHKGNFSDSTEDLKQFSFGSYTILFEEKRLMKGAVHVELSYQEYNLLAFFIKNRNIVLSRDKLLDGVWGYGYEATPTTRTVDVHVAWLRQKLKDTGRNTDYILTVRKHGYKFSI